MTTQQRDRWLVGYHLGVTALTLLSVFNVGLLLGQWGPVGVERQVSNGLLVIFAIDYFVRLARAQNRKIFLIQAAFDLLGIIPMHPVFACFRLGRLVRLIRAHHLFWRLGLDGAWTKAYHRFIYSTGFIYLFSISVAIIVLSAFLFSVVERQSLANSLWWAVTTATTVGYGDQTPHTAIGKIIASVLMFGGIGFIGLLTSTITDFFTTQAQPTTPAQPEDLTALLHKIDTLTAKVDQLQDQVRQLDRHR